VHIKKMTPLILFWQYFLYRPHVNMWTAGMMLIKILKAFTWQRGDGVIPVEEVTTFYEEIMDGVSMAPTFVAELVTKAQEGKEAKQEVLNTLSTVMTPRVHKAFEDTIDMYDGRLRYSTEVLHTQIMETGLRGAVSASKNASVTATVDMGDATDAHNGMEDWGLAVYDIENRDDMQESNFFTKYIDVMYLCKETYQVLDHDSDDKLMHPAMSESHEVCRALRFSKTVERTADTDASDGFAADEHARFTARDAPWIITDILTVEPCASVAFMRTQKQLWESVDVGEHVPPLLWPTQEQVKQAMSQSMRTRFYKE